MTQQILHLTDLHVFADRERLHYDINPYVSLKNIVTTALSQLRPDAVLVSGDLCQDESREGYQLLCEVFRALPSTIITLPGNHDNLALMQSELTGENTYVLGKHTVGAWDVIAADCALPGKVYGEFGSDRLRQLDGLLRSGDERPTLLSFHQPPVACGSAWLDQSMLRDADALAHMLGAHPQVKAIVCGHIHQAFEGSLHAGERRIPVYTTPSTCRQFGVRRDPFTLSDDNPGWRWFSLNEDTFSTRVERLSADKADCHA